MARSQTSLEAGKNTPAFVLHLKFNFCPLASFYFTWPRFTWPHFTLLGPLACSFHYRSPCILRDAGYSPSDHHLHELSGLPRPLFYFPMSAIYSMSQEHYTLVGDEHMEGKPTATHKSVRLLKPAHWR